MAVSVLVSVMQYNLRAVECKLVGDKKKTNHNK